LPVESDRSLGIGRGVETEAKTAPPKHCRAVVDSSEDGTNHCTIYSTAPGDSLITTWISADGDSYIGLKEFR